MVRPDLHALGIGGGKDRADGIVDHAAEIHLLHVQAELAGDDPRHIEHVLDDLRQHLGVALENLQGTRLPGGIREDAAAQHACVAENRVQGRPQFMGQGAEELVLEPVGFVGLFVDARVFDGERRAGRHVLREAEIGGRILTARFGEDEGERAERPAAGEQRHADVRRQPDLAEEAEVVVVARGGDDQRVRDVGHHRRLARPDDLPYAARGVSRFGVARLERLGEVQFRRDRRGPRPAAAAPPARPRCRPRTSPRCRARRDSPPS